MTRSWTPWLWVLCLAAALPALLLPVSNPDLFWHLSAARRMFELRAVPREDWLSWTMNGAAWVDFEWMTQLILGAAYRAGGLAGVWFLKLALLLFAAWRLDKWLKLYGLADEWRAMGLALWSAAMLPGADARPELFSLIFFIEWFRLLEQWRVNGRAPGALLTAVLFALWANLHAGFAYGLALAAAYTAAGLPRHLILLALAGTLVNPSGWRLYAVLAAHAQTGEAAAWINEWKAPELSNPWRWAELALVPLSAVAAAFAFRRGRLAWAPAAALAALAALGLRHARLGVYFASAGVPLALSWLAASGMRLRREAAAALCLLCLAWGAACAWPYGLARRVFNDRFVPSGAAAFLEAERGGLAGKRLYNPWGWGGYLGWRLGPGWPVFQDGRYLFHPLLLESAKASADAAGWTAFLERKGVEVALLENIPLMLPTTRRYPDGSGKEIARPYYTSYMPRERWALVYFDPKTLVFARRDAAPARWLQAHEFRWLKPYDDPAREDALSRGEIPPKELEAEQTRYALMPFVRW